MELSSASATLMIAGLLKVMLQISYGTWRARAQACICSASRDAQEMGHVHYLV